MRCHADVAQDLSDAAGIALRLKRKRRDCHALSRAGASVQNHRCALRQSGAIRLLRFTISASSGRVLIYSHDSFGLGHIRRCRTIAHALAEAFPKLKVLIVSGSPIIGSFDFKTRVDFVRVPGIIKLRNGDYVPLGNHGSIQETTALRSSLITETALKFTPDVFIVDKEPLGLRGELEGTLDALKGRGTRLVLGLRDVLDEPETLAVEWQRKRAIPAVEQLYDDLWVYGLKAIYDPLQGLGLSGEVARKTTFTGYLRRTRPAARAESEIEGLSERILVTPGGGGDGELLIDWAIGAYEREARGLAPGLIVLGPFMRAEARAAFERRAAAIPSLRVLTFEPRMEHLMAACLAAASMGGYNTFCEILSFDKRALIVPRHTPRMEQTIRAEAAQRLGLTQMLPEPREGASPDIDAMVRALKALPQQPLPSVRAAPGLLDGLERVVADCGQWLGRDPAASQL
jgi:predicted glycosyltransferase